jgi:hypothetical protein
VGNITKLVTEQVRASDLPEHVRLGLAEGTIVRVTVEPEPEIASDIPGYGFAAGFHAQNKLEPADFIRHLRDEWEA